MQPGAVQGKEPGYRWAGSPVGGGLNFPRKCLMAPAKIIGHVVVHELSHMHHRDHTDLFWNEVDKVMPDYRERKEWLRQRGRRWMRETSRGHPSVTLCIVRGCGRRGDHLVGLSGGAARHRHGSIDRLETF